MKVYMVLTLLGVILANPRDIFTQGMPDVADEWTERDYAMEKINMEPAESHYYRDWRGGWKFWSDFFFPELITDVIDFSVSKVGCAACKLTSFGVRTIFGNVVARGVANELIIGFCDLAIHPLVGYDASTCRGIITQQFEESIYSVILDDFFEETSLCVFEFHLCEP